MRFFERRSPHELWHIDVLYFIMPNHEKIFIIGYLDDYSRYMVSQDLFYRQTVENTIDLLKKACGDYTFPKEIQTDGGRQFVSWTGNNQFGTYQRNHQIKPTVCRRYSMRPPPQGATSLPPGSTAPKRESWTIAPFNGDFSISI